MLQQENRLRKLRDFTLVMKHGQWVNGRFLDIKVLELAKNQNFFPKKEDPESFQKQLKLAIAAGLKVHKSAVKRNRVRRQIREVLRLLLKDGQIKTGYYILVVAKKDILDKDYAEISDELKVLLSRVKVINK
ncbi:MAG: Ribonuclease P protein component [Candidatus Magasanikbacteria bacterium GW2011_GWA2_40_10]|uniref:Ribonuclease P protein component n=1 Tax=Candidatus Magasanikbacteria bacterium GW2011_GWA2_40_10 TaxID=1619037 RepID=A0A0G0Q370_9BACT|nr:MAG: Ribonuclease P protein component [Candidatus Magasanikbacteria bacterium GW2011_GWA2_40_10]